MRDIKVAVVKWKGRRVGIPYRIVGDGVALPIAAVFPSAIAAGDHARALPDDAPARHDCAALPEHEDLDTWGIHVLRQQVLRDAAAR